MIDLFVLLNVITLHNIVITFSSLSVSSNLTDCRSNTPKRAIRLVFPFAKFEQELKNLFMGIMVDI